jgi:hypothetical protein
MVGTCSSETLIDIFRNTCIFPLELEVPFVAKLKNTEYHVFEIFKKILSHVRGDA